VVAGSTKRVASRFYQIKAGHCLTGQYFNWTNNPPQNAGGAGTHTRLASTSSRIVLSGRPNRVWAEVLQVTGK